LLREGVPDLHGRSACLSPFLEGGRGHGRAVNAVPARLGADIEHRNANALGAGAKDPVLAHETHGHRVHERIAAVLRGEIHLATQVWDAEAVAVPSNAGDHTLDESARPRLGRVAETKRVEHGDGPRPHREDVAKDAAHPGRSALEWLDERRVVMALDLEGQREVTA